MNDANPNNQALVDALLRRECDFTSLVDRLRDLELVNDREGSALREAVELVRCLRRLVPERSVAEIHRAFGAPGDFGYETPVGDALARTYRGEP